MHSVPAAAKAKADSPIFLLRILPFPVITILSPLPDKYAANGSRSLVSRPLSPTDIEDTPFRAPIPLLFTVSVLPSRETSAPKDFITSTAPIMSLHGSKFLKTVVPHARAAARTALWAILFEHGISRAGIASLKMVFSRGTVWNGYSSALRSLSISSLVYCPGAVAEASSWATYVYGAPSARERCLVNFPASPMQNARSLACSSPKLLLSEPLSSPLSI